MVPNRRNCSPSAMARRSGTEEQAQMELADLAITCYAMADVLGWDLDELIRQKSEVILSRGWKQP